MDFFTIFFIALGLAMDAFAVSITSGFTVRILKIQYAFKIALFFGLFQAIMPLLGWIAGYSIKDFISAIDHWVAFGLLSFIGIKMIYEASLIKKEEEDLLILSLYSLFLLSIATSIDAFAVGFSLSALNISILNPAIIIGIITFLLSFLGVYIGNRFGHLFESKIEIAGGLILIGIGFKILIEHLT